MKTIRLKNLSFRVYDDIAEAPINNWQLHQKYLIYEAGIGSSFQDIVSHHQKLALFLKEEKYKEATEEANNTMTSFYFILHNINPKNLSFACMVHSIEGIRIKDYSDENLKLIINRLSEAGLTKEILDKELDYVKKNFSTQLNIRFPQFFTDDQEEYIFNVRKRNALLVDYYLSGKTEGLDAIDKYFESLIAPKSFDPEDINSQVNAFDDSYETLCATMNLQTKRDVKKGTVYEFYTIMKVLQKKAA